jgi:hypothetical protein
MNIVGAVNGIFTKTKWRLSSYENDDEESIQRMMNNENYGFSIEKVIVHVEPEKSPNEHYNNEKTSKSADVVLEVILFFFLHTLL